MCEQQILQQLKLMLVGINGDNLNNRTALFDRLEFILSHQATTMLQNGLIQSHIHR